ncbi:MAG: hypothetical protein V1664_04185 [Candidatus Uhrbacteria bacterium]
MATTNLLLKAATIEEPRENTQETLSIFTLPVENRNGFAFGAMAINNRSALAEGLTSIVKERFALLASTLQEKTSLAHRFEQTLEAINEEIVTLIKETNSSFNPEKIRAFVGVAIDNLMYISGLGDMTAFFLHKLPDERYQVFNLARSIQTEQTLVTWQKLFSVVLDGDLCPGDVLCVSNRPLPQEIDPEELHALLATLPPQSAAVKIRQTFPLDIDLNLLILKAEDLSSHRPEVSAPASLKQLCHSREQTKNILADQKPTFFGSFVKKTFSLIKNSRQSKQLLKILWKIILAAFLVAFKLILGFLSWLLFNLRRLASKERSDVMREVKTSFGQGTKFLQGYFNRLPKTSRYLILAAAVLILILVLGIFFVARSQENNAEKQLFASTIEKVENLRDRASGAIIYKNEAQARALLKEASTILATAQSKKTDDQKTVSTLQDDLNKISNSLRRDTEVTPEILATTSSLPSAVNLTSLALVSGQLYSLGDDKVLYRVNQTNKNLETATLNESTAAGQEVSVDEGVAVWLDGRPGLDIFNAAENKLTATSTAPAAGQRWVDLAAYGGRIYVLAPGSGLTSQIYRFSRGTTEFNSISSWVKSPTDSLSDGVALTIDGTIFVLKQNGKIVRLVGGQEVTWNQSAVEPVLTSASDIWTSAESLYLYVLDPAGQRLIVYEKETGVLKVQYHSSNLTGLTDFAVDEANKAIYLIGGGNVYKIEASHLK